MMTKDINSYGRTEPWAERRMKQISLIFLQSEANSKRCQCIHVSCNLAAQLGLRKLVAKFIYLRWLHTIITMVTLFTAFLVGG